MVLDPSLTGKMLLDSYLYYLLDLSHTCKMLFDHILAGKILLDPLDPSLAVIASCFSLKGKIRLALSLTGKMLLGSFITCKMIPILQV